MPFLAFLFLSQPLALPNETKMSKVASYAHVTNEKYRKAERCKGGCCRSGVGEMESISISSEVNNADEDA